MSKLKLRLTAAALIAGGALLLLPATGQGAVVFGSRLKGAPSEETPNAPACVTLFAMPCTMVAYIHPIDPNGDAYSGGAPSDGVITEFRTRVLAENTPTQITFHVASLQVISQSSATATVTGTGPTVTIQPSPPDEVPIQGPFAARVPIKKGEYLAVDASEAIMVHEANGDPFTYQFAPLLVPGAGPQGSAGVTEELFIQAKLEPDADHDGFGDETQDGCPRQATTQGLCDDTAPAVGGLRVAKGRVSYTLSETATVQMLLEKKATGRRVGGKCVAQTPRNRSHARCPRFKAVGRPFAAPGSAGANAQALPGGRKLAPGTYRLTITARDVAGNQTVKKVVFQIKRKR